MLNRRNHQWGMSMVELMVGIAISLILMTGVITVMLRITTAGGESVAATRLNQELRDSLGRITKDLQRAGYVHWRNAWDDDDGDGNSLDANDENTNGTLRDASGDGTTNIQDFYQTVLPVLDTMGAVSLWVFPTAGTAIGTPAACTTNCDCVLYSYDLNEDGAQGVGAGAVAAGQNNANFELFGFRWNDEALEIRTAGNVHACDSGTWQDITDANVEITTVTFDMSYVDTLNTGDSTVFQFDVVDQDGRDVVQLLEGVSGPDLLGNCIPRNINDSDLPDDDDVICLWRRNVAIGIQGRLTSDNNVTLSLNSNVKIKNDHIDSVP